MYILDIVNSEGFYTICNPIADLMEVNEMMKYEVPEMEVVLFDDSVLTDEISKGGSISIGSPDPWDSVEPGKGSVLGGEDWWYE